CPACGAGCLWSSFSVGARRAPTSTLFPYTTLFRSGPDAGVLGAAPVQHPHRLQDPQRRQQQDGELDGAQRVVVERDQPHVAHVRDRKSTRLNSSHVKISYAVFCLKKKNKKRTRRNT